VTTRARRFPLVASLLLVGATGAIAWFPRLVGVAAPHALAAFLGLCAVAGLAFASIARFAWSGDSAGGAAGGAEERRSLVWTPIVLALLLRGPALVAEPWLSDDLWRYLWEGKVARAGFSPYELAPDASELAPLRDAIHARVAHRDVPSVYPPLAQLLFRVVPENELAWKLLVVAADVALLLLLRRALARRGAPPQRLLLYAAHPLVALEGATSGHVDVVAWLPLLAGLLALEGRALASRLRGLLAGAATGLSALIKPQGLAPCVGFVRDRNGAALAGVVATVALGFLPFAHQSPGLLAGSFRYAHDWEFDGLAYPPCLRLAEEVKAGLEALPSKPLGLWKVRELGYAIVPNQLARKAALFLFLFVAVALARRLKAGPVALAFAILAAFLATAPVVYPWYVAWLLPFVPLLPARATRAALLLSFTTLAAYAVRLEVLATGAWREPAWLGVATWFPPCLVGAIDLWNAGNTSTISPVPAETPPARGRAANR
jgi:hypothetical protein